MQHMHVRQVLQQQCNQSQIPTHNAISIVESTDEINMDVTLHKAFGIDPQLIYMDFVYIICILNTILQKNNSHYPSQPQLQQHEY